MAEYTDKQVIAALDVLYGGLPQGEIRAYSQASMDNMRATLKAAEPEPEWEYGYHRYSVFGKWLGVSGTSRTPNEWLTTMGIPFRRRKGTIDDWEILQGEDVTYELDPRPWLRPGGDEYSYPLANRREVYVDGYAFKPRNGYQTDRRAY